MYKFNIIKKHLTIKGLTEIVSNKFTMNFCELAKLKESYPYINPKDKLLIDCNNTYINPFWVTGFL